MCIEIQIKDGPRIERCDELWGLIGKDNCVFTHDAKFTAEDCLCHLDVEATAVKAGYTSRPGWDEATCDFIWERC